MNKREGAVASTCFASVVIRCALPPKAPSLSLMSSFKRASRGDQMCVATERPFSHWGLIKQLALFIKCIALTTQSHHILALYSHESIPIGCYELFVLSGVAIHCINIY